MHGLVWRNQIEGYDVFFNHSLSQFLREGLWINLELIYQARLDSWQAQEASCGHLPMAGITGPHRGAQLFKI